MNKTPGTDPRYRIVGLLITHGHIRSWKEIFKHIPKTVTCNDLGLNSTKMDKLVNDPADFEIRQIQLLATWMGIEWNALAQLMVKVEELKYRKNPG